MAKGFCMMCDTEIEVTMCCSGHECGCMGLPIDPPICSSDCYDRWQSEMADNIKEFNQTKTFYDKHFVSLKNNLDNKGWLRVSKDTSKEFMEIYRNNKDSFESKVVNSGFSISSYIRPIRKLE